MTTANTNGSAVRFKLLKKYPSASSSSTTAAAAAAPVLTSTPCHQSSLEMDDADAAAASTEAEAELLTRPRGIHLVKNIDNPVVSNWLKLIESEMEVFVPNTTYVFALRPRNMLANCA